MKNSIVIIFLLVFVIANGQNPKDKSIDEPKLVIDYFAYPRFLDKEVHTSLLMNYQLTDNLQIELQSFYDTYLLTNRFRNSVALKRYLSKRLYLFAGIEVESEHIKNSRFIRKRPPRVGFISGLGYDINSNFSIEGKSNIGINKTSMGAFGEPFIEMPKIYTLGGKMKF